MSRASVSSGNGTPSYGAPSGAAGATRARIPLPASSPDARPAIVKEGPRRPAKSSAPDALPTQRMRSRARATSHRAPAGFSGDQGFRRRDSNPNKRIQSPLSCHWTTPESAAACRNRALNATRAPAAPLPWARKSGRKSTTKPRRRRPRAGVPRRFAAGGACGRARGLPRLGPPLRSIRPALRRRTTRARRRGPWLPCGRDGQRARHPPDRQHADVSGRPGGPPSGPSVPRTVGIVSVLTFRVGRVASRGAFPVRGGRRMFVP